MKWFSARVLGVILSLLLLAGCSSSQPATDGSSDSTSVSSSVSQEEQEPVLGNFTAEDLDGNEVTQEIFAEKKLTMVNIWATFCGPCLREMPDLGDLAVEYEDRDFQIVGIALDTLERDGSISQSQVETAREIVEETGADYLHLLPSEDLISAYLQSVTTVPETFFVDSEGKLVGSVQRRYWDKETWSTLIEEALAEVENGTDSE